MPDDIATALDIVLACRRLRRFVEGVDGDTFRANEEKQGGKTMMRHRSLSGLLILLILIGTTGNVFAWFAKPHLPVFHGKPKEPVRNYSYFLNQLIDLDRLAFLEQGVTCKQFSSYDPRSQYDEKTGQYLNWDANGDSGHYLRVESNKEAVMAEMNGPGCIYRIWSANPQGEIRLYLDGATEPTFAIPFADLFSGEVYPFVPPLVWQRIDPKKNVPRASHSYVPIPYAKSCKVTVFPEQKMYYHVGYQTFPAGTKVETFRLPLTRKETAAVEHVRKALRNAFDASTMNTKLGEAEVKKSIGRQDIVPPDTRARFTSLRKLKQTIFGSNQVLIQPGQQAILTELKGPAMITEFLARLVCDDPQAFRTVMLRVQWDGEERPSIEAPLSEFFGSSFGPTTYHSLPMGKTSTWFYSYWRMPFRKGARFIIVNESRQPAQIQYRIQRHRMCLPDNVAYFHARWRRDPMSKDFDYPFLECTGRGRFVGAAQFIHNIVGGWWGEGDEKVYVDGEKFPSTFGTGSEDYYGDAWGIRWFSNPYAGCPYTSGTKQTGQFQSCYRWHISDFIPFEQSFKITIENYAAKNAPDRPKNDYSSVAYWYQMPGGSDLFQSYSVKDRLLREVKKP